MTILESVMILDNKTSLKERKEKLKKLKRVIEEKNSKIVEAIYADLGKSETESYMCEIGLVLKKLSYITKKIEKLAKPKKIKTPIEHFPAKSLVYYKPYGKVLVMSPWNYPFLLSLEPVIGAYAAGNSVILKTSEYSVNTSRIIKEIINDVFNENEINVIFGGIDENKALLEAPFDYIFFTGSPKVGQIVYEVAAKKLIPVTLELGGKSPIIVDGTYDLKLTARRIIFGKLLNCGQTCVAPDYLIVRENVKDELVKYLIEEIKQQYADALNNQDYGKIITHNHFKRVKGLIREEEIIYGGKSNENTNQIEPTLLNVTLESPSMKEEIFGPILPILTYQNEEDIDNILSSIKTPLAFYIFSKDNDFVERALSKYEFGGSVVNDVLIHVATELPFGGFKESGLGVYHHDDTFYTFVHKAGVLKRGKLDMKLRYQPYTKKKLKNIRKFIK